MESFPKISEFMDTSVPTLSPETRIMEVVDFLLRQREKLRQVEAILDVDLEHVDRHVEQFPSHDLQIVACLDAQLDTIALHSQYGDSDVVSNHNLLIHFSR